MVGINWSLLGAPVDVGGAVRQGFERGMTQSAFAALSRDPTDEGAISRLAMVDPQSAFQMRDRARQERFRTAARSAFDPQTGNLDPVAMRQAYADVGDVEGAVAFDQRRAQTQRTQQQADSERMLTVARLLDDATDQASYDQGRQVAIQMGMSPEAIPETFDPAWVDRQRRIVSALSDQQEMTAFMREAQAAGIAPGTPGFRQAFEAKYAAPPRIMMVNGVPTLVDTSQGGSAPAPELTDEDIIRMRQGGPQASNPAETFPGAR